MKGAYTRYLREEVRVSEALVAVCAALADAVNPAATGRACEVCGGLRDASRRPCDVCAALRKAELARDVEWLAGTDTPDSIARRLGYKNARTLVRILDRDGRADVAALLALASVAA